MSNKIKHKLIPGKLSKKTIKSLIDKGSLKELRKHIEVPLLDFKQLTGLFAENSKKGIETDFEFSRLASLKRESFGTRNLPEEWLPKLSQGSIIREIYDDGTLSDEFLFCIQPRCDSVRIKEKKPFPFLMMTTKKTPADTKMLLVVKCRKLPTSIPVNIKLWLYPFPHRQEMLTFDPDASSGDYIEAVRENEIWIFESNGKRYEWIADMKDFLAQKVCDQLSGRQCSVGIDEYEWLRRNSSS